MSSSDATTTEPKRRYTRLTPATWAEIQALWKIGEVTLVELADRYDVSTRALQTHFAKHAITKGSQAAAFAEIVQAKILEQELPDADLFVVRAHTAREAAYQNATIVEGLVMAQLVEAQSSPAAAFKAASALKALSLAAGTLERLYGLKSSILGLDKDLTHGRDLPELILRDLTPTEIESYQRENGDESDHDDLVDDTESVADLA